MPSGAPISDGFFVLRGGKIMHVSINTAVFIHEIQAGASQLVCLKGLTDRNVDNIEVRGELFNEATKNEEMKQIFLLCADNDWKFFYSIPDELFLKNTINPNFEQHLQMAEKYHVDQLKISLGDLSEITEEQFEDVKDLLSKYNVKVTIENQPNNNGVLDTFTSQLLKLKEADVPVGYTFDSGNWYWVYEDPVDAFKNLSEDITVFHLKDIKDKETVLLDEGATDWKCLVKNLKSDVPVFLEYEISEKDLDGQIQKVNNLLAERVAEA